MAFILGFRGIPILLLCSGYDPYEGTEERNTYTINTMELKTNTNIKVIPNFKLELFIKLPHTVHP